MSADASLRRIQNERDRGFSAAVVVPLGPKSLIFVSGEVGRDAAYVKDLADYPVYAKVRTDVFGADWPASASVGVSDLLLGAKLEVDAVAVIAVA
jgi:hypothetical protein